jgi:hypothetical protein
VNAEPPTDAQEAALQAFALFADANRMSDAARSFHEEKHHLFYSTGRCDFIQRYVSERQHTTGDDVLSAAEGLAGEYAQAARRLDEFVRNPEKGMLVFPESRRVETAVKSVHMWLRAYQDAVCGVLLATRGDAVGHHTSMSDRLKPGKPIGAYLAEHLPEYAAWFNDWRDRRNEMKLGTVFRTVIDGEPPRLRGLSFQYPRSRSVATVSEGFISLDDVITGLQMSQRLTEVVRAAVEARINGAFTVAEHSGGFGSS